jgi:hypothetical protein
VTGLGVSCCLCMEGREVMWEVKGRHDEGSHPASVCNTKMEVAGRGGVAQTQGTGACLPCVLILIRMKGWVRRSGGGLSPGCVKGGREGRMLGALVPCMTKGDGMLAGRGGCRLAGEEGRRCSWVEGTRAHCPACSLSHVLLHLHYREGRG